MENLPQVMFSNYCDDEKSIYVILDVFNIYSDYKGEGGNKCCWMKTIIPRKKNLKQVTTLLFSTPCIQ